MDDATRKALAAIEDAARDGLSQIAFSHANRCDGCPHGEVRWVHRGVDAIARALWALNLIRKE